MGCKLYILGAILTPIFITEIFFSIKTIGLILIFNLNVYFFGNLTYNKDVAIIINFYNFKGFMEKYIIKIRVFLWLILAVIILWLLYIAVLPSGKIIYINDFNDKNYFIGKLTPKDRVESLNGVRKILGNPVYFALATPRSFSKAVISLKYKNNDDLPMIEVGVLKDKLLWRYDLKPVRNKVIDQLFLVWDIVRGDNNEVLLQREKKYESIEDFLNNMPNHEEMAIYNYDLKYNYKIDDYQPNENIVELTHNLRGAYQFYTYIKEEPLNFSFNFFDLNKNSESDEVEIFVYHNGQVIESHRLKGAEVNTGVNREMGNIEINTLNLPEGVYKIEVKVSDDIITNKIFTSQTKVSFINKLWLNDVGRENLKLYTDSRTIGGQTVNPSKLQTIKISDSELNIEETYKLFTVNNFRDISAIILQKDDVIISGDGVFSLTNNQLFNPEIKKVGSVDLNYEGINYVLAKYSSPTKVDDWQVAGAEFDLNNAYREDGKYNFIISIPGFRADDEINDKLEIDEIKVELSGKTLLQKIEEMLLKSKLNNE